MTSQKTIKKINHIVMRLIVQLVNLCSRLTYSYFYLLFRQAIMVVCLTTIL